MKWSAKETFQNLSYVLLFFLNWKNSHNFLFFILCYVFFFSLMNAPFFLKSECTYHISIVTKVSIKSNKRKKRQKSPNLYLNWCDLCNWVTGTCIMHKTRDNRIFSPVDQLDLPCLEQFEFYLHSPSSLQLSFEIHLKYLICEHQKATKLCPPVQKTILWPQKNHKPDLFVVFHQKVFLEYQ